MMQSIDRDDRGVVSVEFALAAVVMMTAMLNAADVGGYVYQAMQVENAAQMAVQTALQTCTSAQVPATTLCNGLTNRVIASAGSTSLGNLVTVDGGQPTEAYYCANDAGRLIQVGTVPDKPTTCAAVGKSSVVPGDYDTVSVSYTFKPLMPGASVAALLTTPIRRSAIMRIG